MSKQSIKMNLCTLAAYTDGVDERRDKFTRRKRAFLLLSKMNEQPDGMNFPSI